jgi:hypothetical protein
MDEPMMTQTLAWETGQIELPPKKCGRLQVEVSIEKQIRS